MAVTFNRNVFKHLFEVSRRVTSSSDDSVSSLSLNEASTFSYCNNRSNKKLLSLFTLSSFLCVDLKAS